MTLPHLYHDTKKGFKLLELGVEALQDIPQDFKLSDNQTIQRVAVITGQPYVDHEAIRQFLEELTYPLHLLDFETLGPAIPLFDGTRPYQQIPFQFSCHVLDKPNGKPKHHQFLASGQGDPRSACLQSLQEAIGPTGSIVAYNASFEKRCLRQCAEALPAFAPWVSSLEDRFVDLLVPFREFSYYHPAQAGSASMKVVLPALTGQDYGHLAIQEGETAAREFLRVTFGDVSEREREEVRHQLEQYCGLDTEGMIWIVDRLRKLTALA